MRRHRCVAIMLISFIFALFVAYNYLSSTVAAVEDKFDATWPNKSRYAIIVDAGSSGSRLFVYCIPALKKDDAGLPAITLCVDSEGKPLTKKVTPGLSSFANDPASAKQYISGLMSVAAQQIPKAYHSVTPAYILATAGMRLLTER